MYCVLDVSHVQTAVSSREPVWLAAVIDATRTATKQFTGGYTFVWAVSVAVYLARYSLRRFTGGTIVQTPTIGNCPSFLVTMTQL
jgi:hypothetical protein